MSANTGPKRFHTAVIALLVAVALCAASVEPRMQVGGRRVHPENRRTLEILHNATNGPQWRNKLYWSTFEPVRRWYGVSLVSPSGYDYDYVSGLALNANGLVGALPEELARLSWLRGLDLGTNAIYGPIPPGLGQLPSLSSPWKKSVR